MRKAFLSVAVFVVAGSMFQTAFACELDRGAGRQDFGVVEHCSGSTCLFDPLRDPLAALDQRTSVGPTLDCDAVYFDPGIYTGTDGLMVWLMATLGTESQYRLGAGFTPSPMEANAQYR
jgi:hypothetical protein